MSEPSHTQEDEQEEPESNDPLAIMVLAACAFMFGLSMLVFSALLVVKKGFNDVIWAIEVSAFFTSTLLGIYLVHMAATVNRRQKLERAQKKNEPIPYEDIYDAWKRRQGL